jgi:hypothetical protein
MCVSKQENMKSGRVSGSGSGHTRACTMMGKGFLFYVICFIDHRKNPFRTFHKGFANTSNFHVNFDCIFDCIFTPLISTSSIPAITSYIHR